MIPTEALSDATVNKLIEDGSPTGLEAANRGVRQRWQSRSQRRRGGRRACAGASTEAGLEQPAKPGQQQPTGDAAPRTLYVSRKVMNAGDILAWARAQSFEETLGDDLHVTITYSRTPVDWFKVGSAWDEKPTILAGGAMMERFGEATVLLFASNMLRWRHDEMVELGASWDHPEYLLHITISYADRRLLDEIEPYW